MNTQNTNSNTQNIISCVDSLQLGEGVAKESKRAYQYLDICFKGGYKKRVFLNDEAVYIINDIISKNIKK